MQSKYNSSIKIEDISKDRLINDFKKMGITRGDHVAVTLSLKKVGYIEGGPHTFIEALRETIGPNGTIMMNTHTHCFPISEIPTDYIFDQTLTPTYCGIVPETLRKQTNTIRSRHPVSSITASGKYAKYLTEDHNEHSRRYAPYSKLAIIGGKYLCIGLGYKLLTIIHESQYLAGLYNKVPLSYGVNHNVKNEIIKTFIFMRSPCTKKLHEKLVPVLKKMRLIKIGRIGNAFSILASADRVIDTMALMLKKDNSLILCDDIFCLWCREFERRRNLYKQIKDPKYFQKNLFLIRCIELLNKVRLKRYNILRYTNNNRVLEKLIGYKTFRILSRLIYVNLLHKKGLATTN